MIKIDCKEIAELLKNNVSENIREFKSAVNHTPALLIIQVGNNDASNVYVRNKIRVCESVGIKTKIEKLNESITEEELLNIIEEYNNDDKIDGIIVQLPLPEGINENIIKGAVLPEKDVDGFNPYNVGKLQVSDLMSSTFYLPATAYGIKMLLHDIAYEISGNARTEDFYQGKHAVIIGRSDIVGQPCAQVALKFNMTTTICHSHTKNLEDYTKTADVIIVAVGKPGILNYSMLKPGAIVIDVGINRVGDKLCGDFDPAGSDEFPGYYTPVPGGVGVLTTAGVATKTVCSAWLHMYEKERR